MVTIDALGILLYAQAILTAMLFLFVQILVVFAPDRFDQVGDWIVYRGTWVGIFFQCLSVAIVAALVFFAETDHTRVTWTLVLILSNAVWFASLRIAFLISDYRYTRHMRRKEQ